MMNRAQIGDDVIKPGWPDGPRARNNRIGVLRDFSYLGHYETDVGRALAANEADVGLVALDEAVATDDWNLVPDPASPEKLKKISGMVSEDDLLSYRGKEVFKFGRSSQLTRGTFSGFVTEPCPIKLPDGRTYLYSNVVQVARSDKSPFSKSGDSGALVYTEDFKGLGLVVGGNDLFSWVAPLASCLSTVSARLLT
jgi:hypothetical protein